jgi:hypothetical protein
MTEAIRQPDAALRDLLSRADAIQQANRLSQLRREQERRTLERIERTPVDGAL